MTQVYWKRAPGCRAGRGGPPELLLYIMCIIGARGSQAEEGPKGVFSRDSQHVVMTVIMSSGTQRMTAQARLVRHSGVLRRNVLDV